MQHRRRRRVYAALALSALCACGSDGRTAVAPPPTEPDTLPPPARAPAALMRVSSPEQFGFLGRRLDEPLIVRVVDAGGAALAGVPVAWSVVGGLGSICARDERDCQLGGQVFATDTEGRSTAWPRPAAMHENLVTAMVTGLPALSATFTVHVPGVLIRAQPLFDCVGPDDPVQFSDHEGKNSTSVAVGTVIAFEFARWLLPGCAARIASTNAPPGDAGFDSGELSPGQRFQFVPTVPGTWTFREVYSGAVGTLVSVASPTASKERTAYVRTR